MRTIEIAESILSCAWEALLPTIHPILTRKKSLRELSYLVLVAAGLCSPAAAQTVLFDFDNAPLHSPLPINLTVGGITAHFSATGQGYSIQQANALGFTPAGFSGFCIYPSSIYAADFLVGFSKTLTDFSILYAPQELGCDDSATMRVTAYLDSAYVGTNTTTASQPGTWPSETLSFHSAQVFNSVVVHYDVRPATCQDYGTIFLADNMIVTASCTAVTITGQPSSATTCSAGATSFVVTSAGTAPFTYQWQLETTPNNWINANNGGLPYNGGTIIASGVTTDRLSLNINALPGAPAIRFRCIVTNPCGSATSNAATLSMIVAFPGDVNGDSVVDGKDVQPFVNLLQFGGTPSAAFCAADLSHDGLVDRNDVTLFVAALLGP